MCLIHYGRLISNRTQWNPFSHPSFSLFSPRATLFARGITRTLLRQHWRTLVCKLVSTLLEGNCITAFDSPETSSINRMQVNGKIPNETERSVFSRLGTFGGASGGYGTFSDYGNYTHSSGFRLFRQRWYAMFVKRLLHSKRHKLSLISQLLLPLVFTLIALINAKTFPQPTDSPPLDLTTHNYQNNFVPWASDG